MPKEKWLKIATRNLPFVRMVMIYQSFARYKKIIGWPYGDSLTTFDNGIINLYRREKELVKFLEHFGKIGDKKKFLLDIERRIRKTDFGRKKDFASLYAVFLEFWPLANLALALENALSIMGWKKTAARYQKQLVRLRSLSQDKMLRLEKLIDASIKKPSWRLATPDEILKGKTDQVKLKKRNKSILILEKNKVKIVTGGRAVTRFRLFTATIEESALISGQIAFPGKVWGRAKVVFYKNDLAKLKKGDILVSPMTEVDFVPYFKKVSAIVTDEGGLTSHAAIVAREMKKPCIIGTKIATKVLHDGDLVEVDATKGEVKIIKR
jgi:phosphohistidine swiveling domain-containing protein